MSALSSVSGLPATDYLNEPYAIQHGDKAAKAAYAEGVGFEQVFVNQLTQQLTATLTDSSDSSDSGDSSDSSDGSSDATSATAGGPYSSLLSSALTQGVMSSGGAGGLAMQLAESIDPTLALHTK
jgi:hypothetical protein